MKTLHAQNHLAQAAELNAKFSRILQSRTNLAHNRCTQRVRAALNQQALASSTKDGYAEAVARLQNIDDRKRLRILLDREVTDEAVQQLKVVPEQIETLQAIRHGLFGEASPRASSSKNLKSKRPAGLAAS